MRSRIFFLLLFLPTAGPFAQQQIVARDGYEAFPNVEYRGGDATQPKRLYGYLVLTDSTIALHPCFSGSRCLEDKKKGLFEPTPYFTIRLSTLKAIQNSASEKGAGIGEKLLIGNLAGGQKEGIVALTYETATSVEAPVFKTDEAHGVALEAKLRFRLKKLGIELPAQK